MSLNHSPGVVIKDLIMYYDMNNTQKSFKGAPATNITAAQGYTVNNWTDGNATVTRNTTAPVLPPITGYEISKIQSVNGSATERNTLFSTSCGVGYFTHSAYVYLESGTWAAVGQHWFPWDSGTSWYIPNGVWTRIYYTTYNTGDWGTILNAYSTDGTIYVTGVQYETGSVMTSFTGGTRSSTQAVLDITGNNTLDTSNLVYASDNTFSFNGSNSTITANTASINRTSGQEITVSCWIKPARNGGQYSVFCSNRSNDASLYNWIFFQHYDDGAICFHGSAQNKTNYIPILNAWINVTNTVTSVGVSTLYVNGISVYSTSSYTYNGSTPSRLGIGADPGGQEAFLGQISATKIYNRALSATEVAQNFNALRGRYAI